mmetsp:Transcript_9171/g.8245  ORF Transcript_9171/g.8245 Transcript_9171/m.8245 type:complete len:600 (+) Transcript_9171:60-1859(+)
MQAPLQIDVESVGRSFLIHYLKSIVYNASHQQTNKTTKKAKKKKKKKKKEIEVIVDWDCDLDDYYALLGIKQYEMNINQDGIKRAYRKVSLLMHPDKAPVEHRKQAEARYKLIQKAFDTLSDPYEKQKYDSQIEFDDSIPDVIQMANIALPNKDIQDLDKMASELENDSDYEENCKLFQSSAMENRLHVKEDEFYKLFETYFKKWSRYSNKKGLSTMGNAKSSDEFVKRFYESWRKFKSWRLFLHEEEIKDNVMDPNTAENNKEKKWMIKENQMLQAPFKKEESMAIEQMVESAYIRDPRITRMLIKEKEEFLRDLLTKKKRKLKKQRQQEEKERLYKEKQDKIRREKEAEEKKKRDIMAKMRAEKTEIPSKLRSLCNDEYFRNSHIKPKNIDTICFNASIEDIKTILNQETKELQLKKFDDILVIAKKVKKEKKKAEKERKRKEELEKQEKLGKPWNDDELNILINAVGRFPGGTMNRWEKIQKAVGKDTRTVDEIIAKVKDLQKSNRKANKKKNKNKSNSNNSPQKNNDNDDPNHPSNWSKEQQSALENALRAVRTLPAQEKWDKVAEMVVGKTKKQCVERFKWIRAQLQAQRQQQK